MNTQPPLIFPLQKKVSLNAHHMMFCVLFALVPGVICHLFLFGWAIFYQLVIAITTAVFYELILSKTTPYSFNLLGLSTSIISCVLLAISIPSIMPWYIHVTGLLFALIFGKAVYGGVGMNIFNPAMVGFCFLYLSFPSYFSTWSSSWLSLVDAFHVIFTASDKSQLLSSNTLDAVSQATTLQKAKLYQIINEISYSEVILQIAWAIGGIFLCVYRIADWRLVISFIISSLVFSVLFYGFNFSNISPQQLLTSSGIGFAAWFIITDPATAATSNFGRHIYGMTVGFLIAIIQTFGVMPDSIAFAILLGNLLVPLIDSYTKPKY